MQYILKFSDNIFKNWGFAGLFDYITTILGVRKTSYFGIQFFAFLMAWFFTFVSDWIWDPPLAAVILVGMTLANSYYGYLVSKTKGERWDWGKFKKTGHIIASDLLAMSLLHLIITIYPYYEKGADVLFAHFAGFKFRELFIHWRQLDFKKGGLSTILGILKYKEVEEIIEKTQRKETPVKRSRTTKTTKIAEA